MRLLSTLVASFALTPLASGLTSSLVAVTDFTTTVEDVELYAYIPATSSENPAIVVAIHSCNRNAQYYFDNTGYASLADQHGFIVLFPNSTAERNCWDTTSKASTTQNGGGQSQGITDMVTFALEKYNGDASRVSMTGSSSGADMVNLLAGIYPSFFYAGSVFSGTYTKSIVPSSGPRTKMMIWHGTIDELYPYSQLRTELDGWSGVLAVDFTQNITDTPTGGYTKMVYGDGSQLIGISAAGVGHTVPVDAVTDLAWFCIFPSCDSAQRDVVVTEDPSLATSTSASLISTPATTQASQTDLAPVAATTSPLSFSTSITSINTPTSAPLSSLPSLPASAPADSLHAPVTKSASPPSHAALSAGAKAGISIAAISIILSILAFAFWIRRRRQLQSSTSTGESEPEKALGSGQPGVIRQASYGAMPTQGDIRAGEGEKKKGHRRSARSFDGLLSFVSHRDSSSTLEPPGDGEGQRWSRESVRMGMPGPRSFEGEEDGR